MSFGIYIHIPYCIQRCHYCDFTTFVKDQIMPPEKYIELVKNEIRHRASFVPHKIVDSIYFGGGTPSLIKPELIISLIDEIENCGFSISPDCETTIEINPATLNEKSIDLYLSRGINRFSVGAQTFNDQFLKDCGREHNSKDTIDTLTLLDRKKLNYSFDLLFALPHQTSEQLLEDLNRVKEFNPSHLSAYCLTVPTTHPMDRNRASNEEQADMLALVEEELKKQNLLQYELSNFAKPGFESKHNSFYWTDQAYWGLGLSAHSYFPSEKLRFWNPKRFESFEEQGLIQKNSKNSIRGFLPSEQFEILKAHEYLSDFCYTHLRLNQGLSEEALHRKFKDIDLGICLQKLDQLQNKGLVISDQNHWKLTKEGRHISNLVFSEMSFSAEDIC